VGPCRPRILALSAGRGASEVVAPVHSGFILRSLLFGGVEGDVGFGPVCPHPGPSLGPPGSGWPPPWEQSTPSGVASSTTPPSSTDRLKRSMEGGWGGGGVAAEGEGEGEGGVAVEEAGLKSSGVLEDWGVEEGLAAC